MKYTVSLPDYYTVKHYREFDKFAHLEEQDQMLGMIAVLTEHTIDELREWPIQLLVKVYNELNTMIKSVDPEFYPVVEWNGKLYGYQPMHKMSAGEYIDLDNLTKNVQDNLNDILAILYRPVTENKLDSTKFVTKTVLKAYSGKVENAFDYYKVEKYDNENRGEAADHMNNFPIGVALGALSFFLSSKLTLLNDSQISFPTWDEIQTTMKKEMKSKTKFRLANIMAGYTRFMNLQKLPSYPLQETAH